MPMKESPEQKEVREAAEMLTQYRSEAAEREVREVTIDIDTLRILELTMWMAYAEACARGGEQ